MRIAFLDSWLQSSAEGSGTAVAIGGLQRALLRQGIQITRLAPTGQRPHNLNLRRLLFNIQIPALLRRLRYDLVIGFDIDGFLWSGATNGTPYLTSIKGVAAEEARQEQGRIRALLWSLSRFERHNARHAAGVLTTSEYCRRAIERHYGVPVSRVRLVPEGIDLAARRAPAARRGGDTILCVARQYPRKHVADLLRAMPLVRQQVPRARAVIVGDGPEHAALQRLHADLQLGASVQLLGAVPSDADVLQLYAQADVFCLPSVQEGFGIAFLEAMAAGLPVVATNAAAIPEVVPAGQAGTLVPPGDAPALAQALVELLGDPQRRRAYGQFGSQHVERYDWDRVTTTFLDQVQPFL